MDCVLSAARDEQAGRTLAVTSPAETWSLEYVELATHFGRSHGLLTFYILPATVPHARPGVSWIVGVWLITALVMLVPAKRPAGLLRLGFLTLTGLVAGVVGLVVLAPWVSEYRIVLPASSVIAFGALIALPQLLAIGRYVRGRIAWTPGRVRFAAAVLVALSFALVAGARLREAAGNHSALVWIDQNAFDRNPLFAGRSDIRATLHLREGGYDGQFMYFAAFDPLMLAYRSEPQRYRAVVDAPPYRFGRIGFAWLTKLVSLGRWQWYPAVMVWLVVVSAFTVALIVGAIAGTAGASPWSGLMVALVPGFWVSLQAALPEPLAAAFLVGGYYFVIRDRWIVAGLLFGGSLLVRETGVLFILLLLAWKLREGPKRAVVAAALAALVPVAAWRLYVGSVLYPDWGWQAFYFDPHDLGAPFMGFVDLWQAVRRGEYIPGVEESAIWFPLVLTGALALAIWLAAQRASALTWATVAYAAIAVSLNYKMIWVHVSNGQRGTYELFLLLLLSTIAVPNSRRTKFAMAAFWVLTASYVFIGAFDAPFIRGAIFPGT